MLDFTQLNLRMRPEIFRFPSQKIKNVMEMVDKKMQQFAEKTHVVKTGRVAVWAALDFAGELYKLRKEYEKLLAAAKE